MTREQEIKQKAKEIASNWDDGRGNVFYHRVDMLCYMAQWADKHPKNPWITDRMPEIKGLISDAVVLLIDGMFYRISHLERRKDGTEFWWGVHPEDGEEVDAWMPIPELPKGGKK